MEKIKSEWFLLFVFKMRKIITINTVWIFFQNHTYIKLGLAIIAGVTSAGAPKLHHLN